MKKIFLLIMLLLSSHAALALEMDVHPIAAVGYRPGRFGIFEMGPGAFYMSGKITTFGHQFEPCSYVNFL